MKDAIKQQAKETQALFTNTAALLNEYRNKDTYYEQHPPSSKERSQVQTLMVQLTMELASLWWAYDEKDRPEMAVEQLYILRHKVREEGNPYQAFLERFCNDMISQIKKIVGEQTANDWIKDLEKKYPFTGSKEDKKFKALNTTVEKYDNLDEIKSASNTKESPPPVIKELEKESPTPIKKQEKDETEKRKDLNKILKKYDHKKVNEAYNSYRKKEANPRDWLISKSKKHFSKIFTNTEKIRSTQIGSLATKFNLLINPFDTVDEKAKKAIREVFQVQRQIQKEGNLFESSLEKVCNDIQTEIQGVVGKQKVKEWITALEKEFPLKETKEDKKIKALNNILEKYNQPSKIKDIYDDISYAPGGVPGKLSNDTKEIVNTLAKNLNSLTTSNETADKKAEKAIEYLHEFRNNNNNETESRHFERMYKDIVSEIKGIAGKEKVNNWVEKLESPQKISQYKKK